MHALILCLAFVAPVIQNANQPKKSKETEPISFIVWYKQTQKLFTTAPKLTTDYDYNLKITNELTKKIENQKATKIQYKAKIKNIATRNGITRIDLYWNVKKTVNGAHFFNKTISIRAPLNERIKFKSNTIISITATIKAHSGLRLTSNTIQGQILFHSGFGRIKKEMKRSFNIYISYYSQDCQITINGKKYKSIYTPVKK